MSLAQALVSRRWGTAVVWLAFGAITTLYFFGLAASSAIGFGPPMSFSSVVRRVSLSNLFNEYISWRLHGSVLIVSAIALFAQTFVRTRRVRIMLPLLCMLTPFFWTTGGVKGIAQWLLAMPAAPLFTLGALAGGWDGEFYAEGFLVFAAVGWWMILWFVLFCREISKRNPPEANSDTNMRPFVAS